uniref:t-SNARE coiled-coil homology domain-containing protein n=1 Tax=Elaeophora elaphi TaxID=1147741 RepID=A0A0R3S3F5_9BILA
MHRRKLLPKQREEEEETLPPTTFEKKRHVIEERIDSVKQGMLSLRQTMEETTRSYNIQEVIGIFGRVVKLQNLVDQDSEEVQIQMAESRKFRHRKIMEHRCLMRKSKYLLDESEALIRAFEAHVKKNRKRQLPGTSSELPGTSLCKSDESMQMEDDQQLGCSWYQYNNPNNGDGDGKNVQ